MAQAGKESTLGCDPLTGVLNLDQKLSIHYSRNLKWREVLAASALFSVWVFYGDGSLVLQTSGSLANDRCTLAHRGELY